MSCETCVRWRRLPTIEGVSARNVELGRCGWDGKLTVRGWSCADYEQRVDLGAVGGDVSGAGVRTEVNE